MDNIAKSLIGLAITGITAAGGYYGWQNLSFKDSSTQEGWAQQNANWFNTKWKNFEKKVFLPENNDLWKEWHNLNTKLAEGESLTDYQIAKRFKEWCASQNTIFEGQNDFARLRAECKQL
ncbi:hypothetical protein A6V39_05690 [Candidatus Mycoplasma haematobovis]|uniref:Uncharacterized protein n=1 Tax=Candidatus Mycoplasma haematobovis TaxID=432608 RepID=A0A1A9QGD1_9MOLU|nr:hypothetical protein [Candidatus Mycoplasma haematobovis]OAL10799.1 hypothetical protein A6V39_05690 [Candidatus Mycoplasma haematobovis]